LLAGRHRSPVLFREQYGSCVNRQEAIDEMSPWIAEFGL
jgi:hypothetical protein